jgi:hypothetical protein
MAGVKTTIEIPDLLFRQAKALSAQRGMSLKQFFTEAVDEQLRRKTSAPSGKPREPPPREPPWMKVFGGLRDLHRENKRIERITEAEFETIDEGEWR